MKFTSQLALAGLAAAVPTFEHPHQALRRQMNAGGVTDPDILNFALTLEHLENTFYKQALAKFPQAAFDKFGSTPRLRFNVEQISNDESTHVSFLTSALKAAGAPAVAACTYDFGLTDVNTFLQTSRTLEGVGVSAYLGAAAAIANPEYLTAAGSILTVESRHDAYIRDNQMAPGPQSPFPDAFDIPLSINQVYTLASPFIVSCPPSNPPLPVKAFPALAVADSARMYLRAGMQLPLVAPEGGLSGNLYCGFPAVAGPFFTKATLSGDGAASCEIPDMIPGQSYVVLTTSNKEITDDNTVAGPAALVVQAPYTYPGFPM